MLSIGTYTQGEIDSIINCIEANPSNLEASFEVASNIINRTPKAIAQKYYKYIRPTYNNVAVASHSIAVLGKNTIRRDIVPDATRVRDAMLHSAFNILSKEQTIKFFLKNMSSADKITLLERVVTRINES